MLYVSLRSSLGSTRCNWTCLRLWLRFGVGVFLSARCLAMPLAPPVRCDVCWRVRNSRLRVLGAGFVQAAQGPHPPLRRRGAIRLPIRCTRAACDEVWSWLPSENCATAGRPARARAATGVCVARSTTFSCATPLTRAYMQLKRERRAEEHAAQRREFLRQQQQRNGVQVITAEPLEGFHHKEYHRVSCHSWQRANPLHCAHYELTITHCARIRGCIQASRPRRRSGKQKRSSGRRSSGITRHHHRARLFTTGKH